MAQKKKARTTKKKTPKRQTERRFAANKTYIEPWVGWVGIVGALLLGAGVFGLWIKDPPLSYASYLVAAGGLGLGVSLWFAQPSITAVFVGDAGVAVEKGNEISRLVWCDIDKIRMANHDLVVTGKGTTIPLSIRAHQKAAAWLLKEAAERVPEILDVPTTIVQALPQPKAGDGYRQEIEDAQVAGRRCAESDRVLTLESDARICPKCGQVYHKDSVPQDCLHCGQSLTGRTLVA